ncbi:MAG: hypothetical protein N2517_04915 [Ignavibacteria bacterium]|nr:hypothetical protein [Ignavibacteria bacterium]
MFVLSQQRIFLQPSQFVAFDRAFLPTNYYSTIFDKQYNIYKLNSSISLNKNILFGRVVFNNLYSGSIIKGVDDAFRNEENLNFTYFAQIFTPISLLFQTNYLLNSDSRNIGIKEAERFNGNLGLEFELFNKLRGGVSFGREHNQQWVVKTNGTRYFLYFETSNLKFINFTFNNRLVNERLSLQKERKFSNFSFHSNLSGIFEDSSQIFFDLNYKENTMDYIVPPTYLPDFFERRTHYTFSPSVSFKYFLLDNFSTFFKLDFLSFLVQREYNKFDPTNAFSALRKELTENSISLNLNFDLKTPTFYPLLGISYFYRNEDNSLKPKFEIDEKTLSQLYSLEYQKNNIQTRLNLYLSLGLEPDRKNTFSMSSNIGIMRYDTPSPLNDDDRDEFSAITNISYKRIFSSYLLFTAQLELHLNHLVFLKATRSMLNNWNRIIRLTASTQYRTEFLSYSPSVEIISNYVTFDFESTGKSVQSYAFRQISYRDSLFVPLSKSLSLFGNAIIKFSERGTLFWKEFSMTKETITNEIFLRYLLGTEIVENLRFSFGGRIYNIEQSPLVAYQINRVYKYYSFAPETEIRFFYNDNNIVFLQGWYELKFWNYKVAGVVPNLILKISVKV